MRRSRLKNMSEFTSTYVTDKKYLINVDFPTVSRIHLNPDLFNIDQRCLTGPKNQEDGGIALATEDEVRQYLNNQRTLSFNNKPVTNLRICSLCSQHGNYDL